MPIMKAHHHGFTVSSVDRSVPFYRDLLGLELVRISDRANIPSYDRMLGHPDIRMRIAVLRHPVNEFILELVEYLNPRHLEARPVNHQVGSSHVAYEVDDADAFYDRLCRAGFGAIHPPTDIVRDGIKVARAMYALDPDGISIEIFQEFEDVVKR
jgi:catechol 2,3-dioxygenase-like lactoylglutathione lyase family enzyme